MTIIFLPNLYQATCGRIKFFTLKQTDQHYLLVQILLHTRLLQKLMLCINPRCACTARVYRDLTDTQSFLLQYVKMYTCIVGVGSKEQVLSLTSQLPRKFYPQNIFTGLQGGVLSLVWRNQKANHYIARWLDSKLTNLCMSARLVERTSFDACVICPSSLNTANGIWTQKRHMY